MNPQPTSVAELVDIVRSPTPLIAVGNATKPRLEEAGPGFQRVETRKLRGIVEYDPAEYTVTALAGTPVRELSDALAREGQYLPFDPPWSWSGATLGGTIAGGMNGPGRLRFGGVRDFILGVQMIDGLGRLLRLGGKVVKNAAGFDVPKFLVGSLGRFGVITEATCKVFPRPVASLTLRLPMPSLEATPQAMLDLARGRWEVDALEAPFPGREVVVRLAGPAEALPALARDILQRWPGEELDSAVAARFWEDLGEFAWAHPGGVLVKSPLTPSQAIACRALSAAIPGSRLHLGNGGQVGWWSLPDAVGIPALGSGLHQLGLEGLMVRGAGPLRIGLRRSSAISAAVKQAFDPGGRFPEMDN